ncbi:helix-turn-helix domain-containing protein [Mycobacteroides abscessus subsp. abscessus]|nr:helix-turn-helix domain-containing protein [Mycobacteroides abscessus subsp. abscessus]SHU99093.1 helix-turn-helix domain-containing protein [Mycobacteroides abscessus subsp. abscessus]SHV59794.1 helix-turn-helix domain-containing protein [Mycobacteroides abscessus subsp. abscessus]SHV82390.1 helix-turn-helix domain-containing protein [Mycobacteroides abscessus subsp. abscessus]SHW23125.1 helix-turn-helix domain-containing protein [Mycobacteroides abscessus subsp. abscessus]
MTLTGTTAGRLAGFSGVGESQISQFVCGEGDFVQAEFDLLLACMGFEIRPDRSIVVVQMNRSECRSWLAHRELSAYLTKYPGIDWQSTVFANIDRLRRGTRGQPHMDNLVRWQRIAEEGGLRDIRQPLVGLDRRAIEMREVSPMGGLLPDDLRLRALRPAFDVPVPARNLRVTVAAAEVAVAAGKKSGRPVNPVVRRVAELGKVDGW